MQSTGQRAAGAVNRAVGRADIRRSAVDHGLDLCEQPELGLRDAGVSRVGDRQPHAVELEDAHVRTTQMVLSRGGDPLDERERLVEVAKHEVTNERILYAAPTREGGLTPLWGGDLDAAHAGSGSNGSIQLLVGRWSRVPSAAGA